MLGSLLAVCFFADSQADSIMKNLDSDRNIKNAYTTSTQTLWFLFMSNKTFTYERHLPPLG